MIDTVCFEIHSLSSSDISLIEFFLMKKMAIQNSDGSILYEFSSGSIEGSWDYRICISIHDMDHVVQQNEITGKKIVVHGFVKKYVRIEFSLSKWATGANITNCTVIQDAIRFSLFKQWFFNQTTVMLPDFDKWFLQRLDISYNFLIGNQEHAEALVDVYKKLQYPRRNKKRVYDSSVYFSGTTTTFKIYCKHPEFKAHDLKRYKRLLKHKENGIKLLSDLHSLSIGLLRFETEIHKKKLLSLGMNTVADIFIFDLEEIMKTDYEKIHQGAKVGKIYHSGSVRKLLHENYSAGQQISPGSVYDIWYAISQGQPLFCNRKKKQRALAVLNKLGIPCVSTITEDVPESFLKGDVYFPLFQDNHTDFNSRIDTNLSEIIPMDVVKSIPSNRLQFERNFPFMYGFYDLSSDPCIINQVFDKAA